MYQRTTTTTDLTELSPTIESALRTHAESHRLQVTDDLPAWTTRSINPISESAVGRLLGHRANPDDPDSEYQTLVVVLPTHLVVVTSGAERGVTVLSTDLAQTSVPDDSATDGFTVTGPFEGSPGEDIQHTDLFIGTGPPDGADCRDAVREAIAAARHG